MGAGPGRQVGSRGGCPAFSLCQINKQRKQAMGEAGMVFSSPFRRMVGLFASIFHFLADIEHPHPPPQLRYLVKFDSYF